MKKLYFLSSMIALAIAGNNAFAQAPTITSAAMPQVGYTFNETSDTAATDMPTFTVSAGSATSQTWNYSNQFVTTYTQVTNFVTPSSGTGSSNFPNATLAAASGSNWAYFVVNSSGFYLDGVYGNINGTNAAIDFVPNEVIVLTPFTYNSTNTTTSVMSFTTTNSGQTVLVRQHATRTLTGDAFGTLTTPAGTYSNTLRVKTFESDVDSIFVNIAGSWQYVSKQTDTTVTYTWMHNSQDVQLMQITQNKAGKVTKAQYLKSFANSVQTINNPAQFSLYPNPAVSSTTLSYTNQATGQVTIDLVDITGKTVARLVNEVQPLGNRNQEINLEALHLSRGMYFLQLYRDNSLQTIKLTVN